MNDQSGPGPRRGSGQSQQSQSHAEEEERLRHGSSFGTAAAAYAEHGEFTLPMVTVVLRARRR